MIHQISRPLNSCIGKLTYLFAVESVPSAAVELSIKLIDEFGMDEIDESVSNITGIVMINRKIKEINFESMISVNFFKEHLFSIFVGYMSDHKCGSSITLNLRKS